VTGRATRMERLTGPALWVATERWPLIQSIWPGAQAHPELSVPAGVRRDWTCEEAIVQLVRGRVECVGPTTAGALAQAFGLDPSHVEAAMAALETQGLVLRGRFTGEAELEWCGRRLL